MNKYFKKESERLSMEQFRGNKETVTIDDENEVSEQESESEENESRFPEINRNKKKKKPLYSDTKSKISTKMAPKFNKSNYFAIHLASFSSSF